jgi:dTDP-4-dehydrorhamnose reductase
MLKIPLVHISTDHLFPGTDALADEDFPISPVNIYGRTKAEAELRVLKENPDTLVIRTNFYGWGTSYRQSLSDFIIRALRAGQKVELFDDVFYTPILVETLAQATHDLMTLNAKGVFNVVGSQRLSKFDFGLRLAKEFGLDQCLIKATQITKKQSLIKRPLDMSLTNKKAVGFLGRDFGTINDHLTRLRLQEENGMKMELEKL